MSVGTFFRGRRERYREGGIAFYVEAGARDELASRMMTEGVHPATEEIARRCNDASSWGGYEAHLTERSARIYAWAVVADSDRARRLLSAVDMVQP